MQMRKQQEHFRSDYEHLAKLLTDIKEEVHQKSLSLKALASKYNSTKKQLSSANLELTECQEALGHENQIIRSIIELIQSSSAEKKYIPIDSLLNTLEAKINDIFETSNLS